MMMLDGQISHGGISGSPATYPAKRMSRSLNFTEFCLARYHCSVQLNVVVTGFPLKKTLLSNVSSSVNHAINDVSVICAKTGQDHGSKLGRRRSIIAID